MSQTPTLILVVGKGTSGKTTLGQALSRYTGWPFVDIDEGPALCTLPHPQPVDTPEAFEELRRIMRVRYAVLLAAIESNLREGISHIAAATFSKRIIPATFK